MKSPSIKQACINIKFFTKLKNHYFLKKETYSTFQTHPMMQIAPVVRILLMTKFQNHLSNLVSPKLLHLLGLVTIVSTIVVMCWKLSARFYVNKTQNHWLWLIQATVSLLKYNTFELLLNFFRLKLRIFCQESQNESSKRTPKTKQKRKRKPKLLF